MPSFIPTEEHDKIPQAANRVDFDELDASLNARIEPLLEQWFADKKMKQQGEWFKIGNKGSLSVNAYDGHWHSHETGDEGKGLISLYQWRYGIGSIGDAANELASESNIVRMPIKERPKPKPKPRFELAMTTPSSLPDWWEKPSVQYKYNTRDGNPAMIVARFDRADGKDIRQASWVKDSEGNEQWQFITAPVEKSLLYRGELISKYPARPVLIVEGEKCVNAAEKALPDWLVLSWQGGSSTAHKADWSGLEGRRVIIWPDNDDAGQKAASKIKQHIGHAKVIRQNSDKPKGWDLADAIDEGWTAEGILDEIKAAESEIWDQLQRRKFDPTNLAEPSIPAMTIRDRPIITRGNLLTLVAPDKSGKSHVMGAMMRSVAFGGCNLGIESTAGGRAAYCDFEQDREDFEHLIMHQVGLDVKNVSAYHLTGYGHKEAKAAIFDILRNEQDLTALFIDGYADLIGDVNDAEQSNQLVSELMAAAEKFNVAIIGVLHLNPGSEDKSRGHLGSQLGRKSQTVLQIKRDGDRRIMFTQRARKKPLDEKDGVVFEWSDQKHGFVELDFTPGDAKAFELREKRRSLLNDIILATGVTSWNVDDLDAAIMTSQGCKSRQAKNIRREMVDLDLFSKKGAFFVADL